jgi:hypothetical protein
LSAESRSYDAFLSYAHEDQESVAWLDGLLSGYWVPGVKRRRIFRDQRHITARSLDEQILNALRASRFLIICWSESAQQSTWVPKEIKAFLDAHPKALSEGRVLICRVGSLGKDVDFSQVPESLGQENGRELYVPDLRGRPAGARGSEKRRYTAEGLTLLAPQLGLGDKEEVLRLRRRRRTLFASLFISLCLVGAAGEVAWRWWLGTPPGLFHENLGYIVGAVGTTEIEDPKLFATARALGRMNRRDLIERLSGLMPQGSLRDLFIASGYAALPRPDCAAIERSIGHLDASAAHSWKDPLLRIGRSCGEKWVDRALEPFETPGELADGAIRLAEAGHAARAAALAREERFPRAEIVPLRIAFAVGGTAEPLSADASALVSWVRERNFFDRLYDSLALLRNLDPVRLREPLAQQLLDFALAAASHLANGEFNDWDLKQELAAQLLASGRKSQAKDLLAATAPSRWVSLNSHLLEESVQGWAWRGLAFRLAGSPSIAESCFTKAESAAAKPIEASRTWGEWLDLSAVFARAGDWARAFRAAEGPRDERVRLLLRCRLIELWVQFRLPSEPALTQIEQTNPAVLRK